MTLGLRSFGLIRGSKMFGNLTSKRGNRLYYKGRGGHKGGRHTKHGKYVLEEKKRKEIVMPDLTDFKLKPYVSRLVPKP